MHIAREESRKTPPLEPGTYEAVASGIIDLGTHYSQQWNNESRKVLLRWDIVGESVEYDGVAEPRRMYKQYTLSLNEKAALRHDLETWRSRPFSEEELAGFDLTNILRKGCQLTISNEVKNGATYSNIKAVTPLARGRKAAEIDDVLVFDIPEDFARMGTLLEWIRKRIKESNEYKEAEAAAPELDEDLTPVAEDEGLPF